jgi:hypothetical protein
MTITHATGNKFKSWSCSVSKVCLWSKIHSFSFCCVIIFSGSLLKLPRHLGDGVCNSFGILEIKTVGSLTAKYFQTSIPLIHFVFLRNYICSWIIHQNVFYFFLFETLVNWILPVLILNISHLNAVLDWVWVVPCLLWYSGGQRSYFMPRHMISPWCFEILMPSVLINNSLHSFSLGPFSDISSNFKLMVGFVMSIYHRWSYIILGWHCLLPSKDLQF